MDIKVAMHIMLSKPDPVKKIQQLNARDHSCPSVLFHTLSGASHIYRDATGSIPSKFFPELYSGRINLMIITALKYMTEQ